MGCSSSDDAASGADAANARGKAKGKGKAKRGKRATRGSALTRDPTVVFVVLDTVRSKSLQICGYDRPNTPVMAGLVERGADLTCDAHTPADWTVPSHASYFTGLPAVEHGAVIAESDVDLNPYTSVRPLAAEYETLAETYKDRGYQTLAISGNPVVQEAAGLMQGFDSHQSGPPRKLAGRGMPDRLAEMLEETDTDKPLFLFVNLFDAHDPYPEVPGGVDWVSAQPEVKVSIHASRDGARTGDDVSREFLEGKLSEEESEAFLDSVRNGYDYGIFVADRTLGQVLRVLERNGWSEGGYRLVVTSDHGEFIGEHGLLRHGGYLWEDNTRVPVLFKDTSADAKDVKLPGSMAAIDVYSLVRDGALPDELSVPESISFPNPSAELLPGVHSAAVWCGNEKSLWTAGENAEAAGSIVQYNLASDAAELRGKALEGDPKCGDLQGLAEGSWTVMDRPVDGNEDFTEALKAMGYLDDGELDEEASLEEPL